MIDMNRVAVVVYAGLPLFAWYICIYNPASRVPKSTSDITAFRSTQHAVSSHGVSEGLSEYIWCSLFSD